MAAPLYGLACKLAHESGKFLASSERLGPYFGASQKSIDRAKKQLKNAGWFEQIQQGYFEPNVYTVVRRHEDWAAKHPGQCCVKTEFPWTLENDKLGQGIFMASGGRLQPKSYQMNVIRKEIALSDERILQEFEEWYPNQCHNSKFQMGHFIKLLRVVQKNEIDALAVAV